MYIALKNKCEIAVEMIGNDWRSLAYIARKKSVIFTGRLSYDILIKIECGLKTVKKMKHIWMHH